MSRTIVNFWLDSLLLVLFLVLLWSSAILRFVFPPGPHAAGWTLWKWDYARWSDFQFGCICLLALAVLIHVMLHWTWVCGVFTQKFARGRDGKAKNLDDGQRTLFGVGLLIVILNVMGLGLAAAALMIQRPS